LLLPIRDILYHIPLELLLAKQVGFTVSTVLTNISRTRTHTRPLYLASSDSLLFLRNAIFQIPIMFTILEDVAISMKRPLILNEFAQGSIGSYCTLKSSSCLPQSSITRDSSVSKDINFHKNILSTEKSLFFPQKNDELENRYDPSPIKDYIKLQSKAIDVCPQGCRFGVDYVEHIVLPSSTIQGICLFYNVNATKLRQWNGFSGSSLLLAPKRLIIPQKDGQLKMQNQTSEFKIHKMLYEFPTLKENEVKK